MIEQRDEQQSYLNSIFEKDSEGMYSKDARLYQDFMKFILVKEEKNKPFRLRDLAKWIIKENFEISNYYTGSKGKTPVNSRIANHDRRFKKVLYNLQRWCLITIVGTKKAEKNNEMIPIYSYTPEGGLIALLILYSQKNESDPDKLLVRDRIMSIIQYILSEYKSHITDFIVRLYVNAGEKGFSDSMIKTLLVVLEDNTDIRKRCRNVIDALNLCLFHHLGEEPHRNAFSGLWMKTINDFDPKTRNIILYHFKVRYEYAISECQPPKEWEEIWLKNIHDPSKLVLYGKCENCKLGYPLIIDYYRYEKESLSKGYLQTNCERCKTKGSLYVSSEILRNLPRKFELDPLRPLIPQSFG